MLAKALLSAETADFSVIPIHSQKATSSNLFLPSQIDNKVDTYIYKTLDTDGTWN
jgi:hypothetical protein